jgi:UDP-glucose 4-epimerase
MSICSPDIDGVFEKEKPEILDHHAAHILLRRSVEQPMHDANINILGSINILANSVRHGVKKLIYASSGGAIYGEPEYLPVDESHRINPVSQYGVSKYCAEHYIDLYARQSGLKYAILRYANVYGPRQNPFGEAGVVAIFARQMMRGERPSIFGPGNKTRDYIHVSDIVAVNLLAMERGENVTCNIGTGVETSDQQIFDAVAEAVGYKEKPNYTSIRPGEIQRICLDCKLAKEVFGWGAKVELKKGIDGTIKYFKKEGI